MKERIEELARQAMSNGVCAGEPHYIKDAITTALNEVLEMAAKECDKRYMGDNNREDMEARRCAAAVRKLKVSL